MPSASPLILLATLSVAPLPPIDADTIVRVAAERQVEGELRTGALACEHAEIQTDFDSEGRREPAARRLFHAFATASGLTSRELLAVDGRPPTEKETRKAREENEKTRRKSPGAESSDSDLMAGRLALSDLLHRFHFRYVGEEVLDGHLSYVVDFAPKPGTARKTIRDKVLNEFAGRAWIDVGELQVLRIEGRLTKPVKVAGGLALSIHAVTIVYEGRPVMPGVWAPCSEEVHVKARAALVFGLNREIRYEFSGFRQGKARPDRLRESVAAAAGNPAH